VARLLDGAVPVLMVTDPPYGVEYDADWRNEAKRPDGTPYGASAIGKVSNDDRADWSKAYALFPGDVAYVWHPAGATQGVFLASLAESGFDVRMTIIWAKNMFPISRGHYHVQHEPCFYAVRKGATGRWAGDRKQTTLWQIDKPHKSETGHSTQKPIECMARPMRNHVAPEVYDPFCGSGTSLVAGQNLGRKVYACEISPAYCAVILERMVTAFPALDIFRHAKGDTPA
jgi:DNA modification methylase